MSTAAEQSDWADIGKYLFLGLLAYMPLHILLSTWIGTSFNILGLTKVAKEGVLVMGFVTTLAASIRQPWFSKLLKDKLIWLIAAFGALNLALVILKPTDQQAETLGFVYNTRFLLFFLYALLLTKLFDVRQLTQQALKIVLAVGTLVLFFGIVQYTILPDNALSHLGYQRDNGVLPVFYIDDKPDLERAMSTLRDPNSFGSYIIIIASIAAAFFLKSPAQQMRRMSAWLLTLSVLSLWYTFSRSAWLGFVLAIATVLVLGLKRVKLSKKVRDRVVMGASVALVLVVVGIVGGRGSYFVQNVIFHADESTVLEDPNELRLRFWQESVDDVADNPVGHGPGTAGLASIRNRVQGANLNENYYLQMAYELGVAGTVLFISILVWVGYGLYKLARNNILALGLLASFIGLAATNFFVHIWANEAVAYTWWGLAGLTYALLSKGPESSGAGHGTAKHQSVLR